MNAWEYTALLKKVNEQELKIKELEAQIAYLTRVAKDLRTEQDFIAMDSW